MAKAKDLNFLLEFGQKDLQSARVSTIERYKKQLLWLIYNNFTDSNPELTELRRYQSGIREIIEELKKNKEGTATTEGVKFEGPTYEICGPSPRINCVQNVPTDDKELIGKLLIHKELNILPQYLADDFDYCRVCGNIYAISSKKSRLCSHLCKTNEQKEKAELAKKAG